MMTQDSELNEQAVSLLTDCLRASDQTIILSDLAEKLSVPEKQIQALIQSLQKTGYKFTQLSDQQYKLQQTPKRLESHWLAALAIAEGITAPIHYLKDTNSTNSEADSAIRKGNEIPFAIIAEKQTQGRGRMGRAWFSQDTGNLYLSLGFEPNLPPARMQKLTLWLGLSVCKTLNDTFDLPIQVKWPNDLVSKGKKIAGMLTEAKVEQDIIRSVIFGIGLNINSDITQWPEELQRTAASLSQTTSQILDMNAIAVALIQAIISAYEKFVDGSFENQFNVYWEQLNAMSDKVITMHTNDKHFTGKVMGIDATGALLVELEDGQTKTFQSGDVTLHQTYQAS